MCEHHQFAIFENQAMYSAKTGRRQLANPSSAFLGAFAESLIEDRHNLPGFI